MTLSADTLDTQDPAALAALARSILSCPRSVSLLVDGTELLLGDGISLRDDDGIPTFFAPVDSEVDRAATDQRSALLRITGHLDDDESAPTDSLVLAGRLHLRGECLHEEMVRIITFDIGLVSLVRPASVERRESHLPVPTAHFRHPAHRLNRGYLINCMRHANECHQAELIDALATTTGREVGQLAGVSLVGLNTSGVDLHWVDLRGAHVMPIRFRRPARTPEELAAMLSAELHSDFC